MNYIKYYICILIISSIALNIHASGKAQITEEVKLPQFPIYIAPGNPTGNDELTIEYMSLKNFTNKTISTYRFDVYDEQGTRIYQNIIQAYGTGYEFTGNIFDDNYQEIRIPRLIVWPGITNEKTAVPDGNYLYQVTVYDNKERSLYSPPLVVIIDTIAPEIKHINSNITVFSPNNDSQRDTITFNQITNTAYSWRYQILAPNREVVFQLETTASGTTQASDIIANNELIWDGIGNYNGYTTLMPEGKYLYRLIGRDRAGNKIQKEIPFTLSLKQTELALNIKNNTKVFSPQNKQQLTFEPFITLDEKQLENWNVTISTIDNITVRTFSGTQSLPSEIVFDGFGMLGSDANSLLIPLKDGIYRATLQANFLDGEINKADSISFTIDNTPPKAVLAINTLPNPTPDNQKENLFFGGVNRALLSIQMTYDTNETWYVQFNGTNSFNFLLKEFLFTNPNFPFNWDGGFSNQQFLPDGTYTMYMYSTDAVGNYGKSNTVSFTKDTNDYSTGVAMQLSNTALAPLNFDSPLKQVNVLLTVPNPNMLTNSSVQFIAVNNNSPTYSKTTQNGVDTVVIWNGQDNSGTIAPEGDYIVRLNLSYRNGDAVVIDADELITLDNTAPSVQLATEPHYMSPQADEEEFRTIVIDQSTSSEKMWTGAVKNANGDVVYQEVWNGTAPEQFIWDGTATDETQLPDGTYTYELSAQDDAGNFSKSTSPIYIDNNFNGIIMNFSDDVISPNQDNHKDTVDIIVTVPDNYEISDWHITIHSDELEEPSIRNIYGRETLPEHIKWDGYNDIYEVVNGLYYATIIINYQNGLQRTQTSMNKVFVIENPPQGSIQIDGQGFTPDGDGVNDTTIFNIGVAGVDRKLDMWRLFITDPTGNLFYEEKGTGMPPQSIEWDGKNANNEVVQSASDYTIHLSLQDDLGNTNTIQEVLSTGILVYRDDNGNLRINVPSIVFGPNQSGIFSVDTKQLTQNIATLRQLARVLNRYKNYRILIEGHANHTIFSSPDAMQQEQEQELAPLSKERATRVREALTILDVDWNRMQSVGRGGTNPLFPFNDYANTWKNRRVEFILTQQ